MIRLFCKLTSPFVAWWIEKQEARIIAEGKPLPKGLILWAGNLGIENPSQIRILHVPKIPIPAPELCLDIIERFGFPTHSAIGMCMNRGIYLKKDSLHEIETLKHELVHTLQYQRLGGSQKFIEEYLFQCLADSYTEAPLEREARNVSLT